MITVFVLYLLAVPAVVIWAHGRPMTELDHRLSGVDVELDARRT